MNLHPIQLTPRECEDVSTRLRQCISQSDADLEPYNRTIAEGRELFNPRPVRENPPWPGASDLHIPTNTQY